MTDEHEPGEPAPRPTRRVADIDLAAIAEGLGDNEMMTSWWYDPANGEVDVRLAEGLGDVDDEEEDDDPLDRGMVFIEPEGSRDAYEDMVDFAEAVADPRPGDLLIRALEGRGAFRRFKDTLYEFSDLREQWHVFSRVRAEIRAIRWLLDYDLVESADAASESDARSAVAEAVLATIGTRSGLQVESSEAVRQWPAIVRAVNAGQTVTLLRDGEVWAVLAPGR